MDEALARLTVALADRYRIERQLGAGGMATVFRAHDLRHDRDVAIKVLHPEIGAMLGAQRFLAEITTTAKLQHPHILPLLDSGAADGLLYYVMPVVDGESLRARLERERQLPIDDSMRITREVASALDYSHRHGVVHRDVKPENILLHEGHALVADFGIALALSAAGGERLTATGLSLGTPQYMSPEQATGEKTLDARSDVYSLGCVLYEMLVGSPPFVGATAQAVIAQVITATAPLISTQRPTVPPSIDAAVARALQKIPADRFQSAADLADALDKTAAGGPPAARAAARDKRRSQFVWPAAAVAAGIAGLALGAFLVRNRPPEGVAEPTIRIAAMVPHLRARSGGLAIASKGQFVVVVAGEDSRLFIRRLNAFDFVPLAGTEGAQDPFLSADDQWIAFTANGKLKKIAVDGGPVSDIADATWGGGSWALDGTIIFVPTPAGGLWRTTADGASPQRITAPSQGEFAHWWPQVLPDGHTVLFTSQRTPVTASKIETVDMRTKRVRVLVDDAIGGVYVPSGQILFGRGTSTLYAVDFDASRLEVHGEPKPVLDDVDGNPAQGRVSFAVSPNGTLAYLPQSQWSPKRALVWVDRTGRQIPAVPQPGYYTSPRISPDGRYLAFSTFDQVREVWLYDTTRGQTAAVTHNPPNASFNPVWTPDGRRLFYMSEHGAMQLYSRAIDLNGPEQPVLATADDKFPTSVSTDGKFLAYTNWGSNEHIKFLRLDGRADVPTFPDSSENDEQATFSPDGRWLAYESDASGRSEVYARPFPDLASRVVRVSSDGGSEPRFTRGGREIVFRYGDAILAAAFDPATGVCGAPVTLFTLATAYDGFRTTYDVTADGNRFVMTKPLYPSDASAVKVVLNWSPELRAAIAK